MERAGQRKKPKPPFFLSKEACNFKSELKSENTPSSF